MAEQGVKLIFTGPVGAGKTTAIGSISDIPPVVTDVDASDETLERKQKTTVAMDYGFLELEDGGYVHLYGTPGQERFDFMWDILTRDGLGLILMLDAAGKDPVSDMVFYLDRFRTFIESTAVVIGLTRTDMAPDGVYERLSDKLMERSQPFPLLECDARERQSVRILVETLLAVLQAGE